MNNKGFATSFILFSILVLFLLVMGILIFTLNNSSKLNNKIKSQIVNKIEDDFESKNRKNKASDVFYNNSQTRLDCNDVNCALDSIKGIIGD